MVEELQALLGEKMKREDYQLNPVPDSAGRLASERGLTDMERNGLGVEWQHDFVRRALLSNYDPNAMMEQAGSQLIAGGMENSGVYQAKLPAQIAAAGYGVQMDSLVKAKETSDQYSDRAFGQLLQLKGQQDSMAMQHDMAQKNLNLTYDASRKTWWDYAMQGSQFAANIASIAG